ncbi:hypothetical protein [Halarchaeum grantii]|uniref:hypothetical protein n=1 Tax=Halarchaeum grantii TaxID=1193105 RepID=UPI00166D2C2B|nr:hypothetical protein [Halarchaeum grantii]
MAGTELHISGGNHITLPSRRKDSDANDFDRLDVIFVEAPLAKRPRKLEHLANLIMVPLLVAALYLMLLGQKLFKIAGFHDSHLVYDLAEEYDAEIVEVDLDLFDVIDEYRLLWMLVHYGIVMLAIFALPKVVETFQWVPIPVLVPSVFVAAAVLIFGAFATGTMAARDMRMAYDVEEYSEENSVEDALLVIGALHRAGVKKRLQDSTQVQIA